MIERAGAVEEGGTTDLGLNLYNLHVRLRSICPAVFCYLSIGICTTIDNLWHPQRTILSFFVDVCRMASGTLTPYSTIVY